MSRQFDNRCAALCAQTAFFCGPWRRGRALRWRGHATCVRWRGHATCVRWRGHATSRHKPCWHVFKTCATLLMAVPVVPPPPFAAHGAPPWPALLRVWRRLDKRCLITAKGADCTGHHEARVALSTPSETLVELLLHSVDCLLVPLKWSAGYIPENERLEAPLQLRHLAQVHAHVRPKHQWGHATNWLGRHFDLQCRTLRLECLAADDARCDVAASGMQPLARQHALKHTWVKFLERVNKTTRRRPKPDLATKIHRRVARGLGAGPQGDSRKCPE